MLASSVYTLIYYPIFITVLQSSHTCQTPRPQKSTKHQHTCVIYTQLTEQTKNGSENQQHGNEQVTHISIYELQEPLNTLEEYQNPSYHIKTDGNGTKSTAPQPGRRLLCRFEADCQQCREPTLLFPHLQT